MRQYCLQSLNADITCQWKVIFACWLSVIQGEVRTVLIEKKKIISTDQDSNQSFSNLWVEYDRHADIKYS